MLKKYAIKNLQFNKIQSLITFLLYFFNLILIICAIMITGHISRNILNEKLYLLGSFDGIVRVTNNEYIEQFKTNINIKEIGVQKKYLSNLFIPSTPIYNDITLGAFDDDFIKLNNIQLFEGEMPQEDNEIVIEKYIMFKYFPEYKIGDIITLSDNINEYSFKICGIIEDYSISHGQLVFTLPMIMTTYNNPLFDSNDEFYLSFILKGNKDKFLKSPLFNNEAVIGYITNDTNSMAQTLNESKKINDCFTYILMIVNIILIIITINYNLKKTNKKIGLLKIIGVSNKDIIYINLFQQIILLTISLLFSIIFGIIILFIFPYLAPIDFSKIILIVLSYIIIILSVNWLILIYKVQISIITTLNLYNTKRINVNKNINTKIKNPILLLVKKNYEFNKMETTMSSFLITMAVTVLLVGGFYTKRMIENINSYIPRIDGTYHLFALNSNDNSLAATQDRLVGLTDYDYHLMKNYENFDKIIFTKTLDFYLINHQADDKYIINQVEARKEFNYSENDNTVSFLNMIGYEDEQLNYLKNFVIEGEINIDNIKKGNEFIWNISSLKAQDLGLSYNVGDKLIVSKVIDNKRVDIDVTIGAVIDTSSNLTIDDKNNIINYRIPIICSADTFENLNLDFGFNGFAFLLKDKDDYKDLNMKILEISKNYQADDVQIVYDSIYFDIKSVKKIHGILNTLLIVLYSGLILISLISLIINIYSRINSSNYIIFLLMICGFKKKQLFAVYFLENAIKVTSSFIVGIIISAVLYYVFYGDFISYGYEYLPIIIPIKEFIMCTVSIYVVLAISIFIMIYKNKHTSLINNLRLSIS